MTIVCDSSLFFYLGRMIPLIKHQCVFMFEFVFIHTHNKHTKIEPKTKKKINRIKTHKSTEWCE